VAFSEQAELLAGLTGDKPELEAAIDRIAIAPWTRLDRALHLAAEELASSRRQPGSRPVVVLLTDGRQSQTGDQVVLDEAARVRTAGTVIFTIGVGRDVDASLLEEVAGDPARYYAADDAEVLPEIYRRISESIPCP
jgi:Mg-chelatase subunit ChlD